MNYLQKETYIHYWQGVRQQLKKVYANQLVWYTAQLQTATLDLLGILQNLQDDKHSKLTIGTFFEFMKIAYQVNNNFENSDKTLSTSNDIDWNKLARVNLNSESNSDNTSFENVHSLNDITSQGLHIGAMKKAALEFNDVRAVDVKTNIQKSYSMTCFNSKSRKDVDPARQIDCSTDKTCGVHSAVNKLKYGIEECHQQLNTQLPIEENTNKIFIDTTGSILTSMIKTKLSDILHEGLLDSVLPYMIPKSAISQPIIKKYTSNQEVKKCTLANSNIDNRVINSSTHKEKDRDKSSKINKKSLENEVEIHVCDEEKNIKKNFRCPQKLLVQKMCYFADVTAGQKLEEIDISVHCDVFIFDWLMRWVKKDIIKRSEWPVLEASNVIPIMVSASFLQMEPLLENCLQYCQDNMSDILKSSTILTCLDDNLLTRLANQFRNEDVETLKDKRDKIQSKLFCKLIMLLTELTPDNKKGHYSSLATLFKCSKCGKNIVQSISDYVPCIASAMKIDSNGAVHSKHVRDLTWTLNNYIVTLRTELRSWRKVYWRLWGDCHFLFCTQCNIYFPIHQMDWCCYHPELPQFFINEQQRPTPFPLGRYPCCSQRAYKFEALSSQEGCKYREHIPDMKTQKDINMLNIFTIHRKIIAMEPPQLFFPEKITRLVARDLSLQPGKLMCKDTMWWSGIELTPQRPKLGLLGKIWSGSSFRKFTQTQDSQKLSQKICQQFSVTTDTSSPTSSVTNSDEDNAVTVYEDSSIDEESCDSEESSARLVLKPTNKTKRQLKSPAIRRHNGRCWSGNLNVRYNQDNQRDFEERAAVQMVVLLTKRVSTNCSLILKPSNKQNWRKSQPAGGTYIKLEAEFREKFSQVYKCKNLIGKSYVRVKSNKL